METNGERVGPAIELEAVLDTAQLTDVRHMLEVRLGSIDDATLWSIVTATNELVTNALVHGGRCLGLRAYLRSDRVHIEVDDPSPVRIEWDHIGDGLAIVEQIAASWGDYAAPPRSDLGHLDHRSRPVAKTVWCEIATGSGLMR